MNTSFLRFSTRNRNLSSLCVGALALLQACHGPSTGPSPAKPPAAASQPSASASGAPLTVPNAQELLQTEPPDIERLVWALDGKSFAIVNTREVLLYDATTRQHTATLNAQEISPVTGGGFVGISRATWRPTIWGSDGREIASLPEAAAPPASEDMAKPSFLVSASGQIAVLIQPAPKSFRAIVWDLERRRVVRTLTSYSGSVLSNSGRYLAGAGVPWSRAQPSFVVETLTGERVPLPSTFTARPPRPLSQVDRDGFLFEDDEGYSSVLPNPLQVRAIRLPADARFLGLRYLDAEVVFTPTASGSLIWNTQSQKVIRRLDGELFDPPVYGEGRYFVTRSEASGKYLVRATQDGKQSAEFAASKLLGFRPTTDELTHIDRGGGLTSVDVKSHQARPIAPAGRLERLGAVDLDVLGQRLVVGLQDAAFVWTPEASRVVSVPRLLDVRWGTGSEFATLADSPSGSCSLQLWSAASDQPRKTQELECHREGQWEFSPNPGFLRHEVALTPEVSQLAKRYGLDDLGASKVWVTEERAFEALDQPGHPLSVRVRPKHFRSNVNVMGGPDPMNDEPPYLVQLAFLSKQRVIRLLGDSELSLYDRGSISAELACDFLRRPFPRHGKNGGGSALSPWDFGFSGLASDGKVLFAHVGRSIVADFGRGACRRYPAAKVTFESPRIQPESGMLTQSGGWLATLSQQGALTLWDLEHDTHRTVALAPAISARRFVASVDDRFVVVSDPRQVYLVRTRDAEWLRLRWLNEAGHTYLLYDTSERRYAGAEQALAKVRLRVEQPDAAPLLLDLPAFEARFGARLRDDQLIEHFFR